MDYKEKKDVYRFDRQALKPFQFILFYLFRAMIMRYSWPALVWLFIVLVLTLIPGPAIPDVGFSFRIDKIVHFFIFGGQMVLTSYSLDKQASIKGTPARPILIAAVFCVGAGVFIEFLQRFVPGRSFSLLDMVANTIGVVIGYYVFRYLKKHNRV